MAKPTMPTHHLALLDGTGAVIEFIFLVLF
jgi:hypothetical protein